MLRLSLPAATCLLLAPTTALAGGPGDTLRAGFPITKPGEIPATGLGHSTEAPAFDSPTILFVNFDGAQLNSGCGNDSHNDCSTMANMFGGEILPYPGNASDRAAIIQAVREDVLDFGVIAVGERPPNNNPYAMVLVGDSVLGGSDYHGFAGVAPFIDCGNSDPNITSFALAFSTQSNLMATVVHQEAAHTWGLEHVNDETDNLHPVAGGFVDPKYRDACSKIVANTDLDPSGGQCNSVHTHASVGCNSGYQNSYKEMLLLFGGPILDTVPPTVTIDSPTEGASMPCPVDFDLVITLSDDRLPASLDTAILLNGVEVAGQTYVSGTLTFPITGGIPSGAHTFHVDIADESGNPASAEVHFTVQDNPADPECAQAATTGTSASTGDGGSSTSAPTTSVGSSGVDESGGGDDGCGCAASQRPGPAAAVVALLVPATARRRRRAVS